MFKQIVARASFAAVGLLCAGSVLAAEITVSAAASLTDAFKEIGQRYEARYPDAKVQFNFGASGALLQQIAKGAPVDMFASADQETMQQAERQGLVAAGESRNFAGNSLLLIVPADSALALPNLQTLKAVGVRRIAIGNPASVPVGRYARLALERAGLWAAVEPKLINTQNVRQSLDYVARGEVDAGFVYGTDAAIMKNAVKTAFRVPLDVAISYPIAPIAGGGQRQEARRFIDFVLSPAGQDILQQYGFQKP
ncbi:molybdate ABC transporter substrate-binding protein [Chitiniphilus shinanonensis]|uniref:molybdate ABC transporter substrate-binding protein n=1 Tax=Chitiniphilus shinanonensis TaxID=553088 RepID=UPI00302886F1